MMTRLPAPPPIWTFYAPAWRRAIAPCRPPEVCFFILTGGWRRIAEFCWKKFSAAMNFVKTKLFGHMISGPAARKKWPAKHDNIYWFTKDPENYIYNFDKIDRVPYMAPDLVGKEKAAKGKTLTDVWWNTIVPTNSKEKTGYPTQKPLKIIERILKVHTNENDRVMDFFAGSGTLGEAAVKLRRKFILMDRNPEAIAVINKRLKNLENNLER